MARYGTLTLPVGTLRKPLVVKTLCDYKRRSATNRKIDWSGYALGRIAQANSDRHPLRTYNCPIISRFQPLPVPIYNLWKTGFVGGLK